MRPAARLMAGRTADNRARRRHRLYLATSVMVAASAVEAQPLQLRCGPAEAMAAMIEAKGAQRIAAGISGRTMVEVWATESGEFAVSIRPDEKLTCLALTGSEWRLYPIGPAGEDW